MRRQQMGICMSMNICCGSFILEIAFMEIEMDGILNLLHVTRS